MFCRITCEGGGSSELSKSTANVVDAHLPLWIGTGAGMRQARLVSFSLENDFHSWQKQKQNLTTRVDYSSCRGHWNPGFLLLLSGVMMTSVTATFRQGRLKDTMHVSVQGSMTFCSGLKLLSMIHKVAPKQCLDLTLIESGLSESLIPHLCPSSHPAFGRTVLKILTFSLISQQEPLTFSCIF